ncbi:hypothetical protein [Devosia ginsengisoli]|uniref:hypothetical protein n=1 Tax=Devosia ginsengisoli TaxID=400770 RepID=UPI0026EED748|nr:hypothetical protein [Devosia ginsengisoli]MCR6670400.1 hypothetical protein [Devosia ginsengisoli]
MSDASTFGNPDRTTGSDRFKLRLSAIIWFLLLIGFLLGLPVLIEASIWIVAGVIVLALLLAFPVAWIVRRLFSGQRRQHWRTSYIKAAIAILFSLVTLLAAPIYYLAFRAALQPLTVPQATLSNGTKTVIFQGMMHVGSEGFYKSVIYDLEKALSDGDVIYYEGVVGDPEGDAWFSETLAGGGDLSTNYQVFGDACGLQFQLNYFQLLREDMAAHPERHVNADVTTADMMHEYQRLVATDPGFAAAVEAERAASKNEAAADGGLGQVANWLQTATPGQKSLAGTACRGWITMALSKRQEPNVLDPVILDFRNRKLAERIIADPHQNIYMTYGAGHLPGLLADLQAADPAWEIKSLKWMRTIDTPENLSGAIE